MQFRKDRKLESFPVVSSLLKMRGSILKKIMTDQGQPLPTNYGLRLSSRVKCI